MGFAGRWSVAFSATPRGVATSTSWTPALGLSPRAEAEAKRRTDAAGSAAAGNLMRAAYRSVAGVAWRPPARYSQRGIRGPRRGARLRRTQGAVAPVGLPRVQRRPLGVPRVRAVARVVP